MLVWLLKEGELLPSEGPETRLFRTGMLADALVGSGNSVVWWNSTFNHMEKKFRFDKECDIAINKNYTIKLIHAKSYKKNISLKRVIHQHKTARRFEILADGLERPDVIVACMPTIDLLSKAVLYGNRAKVPVVADIRDLWPDIYEDYLPSVMRPVIRMVSAKSKVKLSRALKNATGIVGLTGPYLRWGQDYAGRAAGEFDRVFPLGYRDFGQSVSVSAVKRWMDMGLKQTDFICSFFGQLGRAPDIETVIEAARLSNGSDIKFVICGTGEKLEHLKKRAADVDNIVFPGWVDGEAIRGISSISSVGLMPYRPSKNYLMNMPNKFAEFLSFGLPVMVQPQGIMTEAVLAHNCGMHYENENELIENIMQLKASKELLKTMGINARKYYEESFRADRVYGAYVEYLKSIVRTYRQ